MAIKLTAVFPHPPLIIPDVGRGQERGIQNTVAACHRAAGLIAAQKPDTIVLITPHSTSYADYIHISPGGSASGGMGNFNAPQVNMKVEYDNQLAEKITQLALTGDLRAGTLGEKSPELDHGAFIPLYFVNMYYGGYKLVRISISGLPYEDHYRLGMCLESAANELGRNVVIIASGDLSHKLTPDGPYGFAPEGPDFDRRVTDAFKSADFLKLMECDQEFCSSAAECGLRAFILMSGALDRRDVSSEFLSYEGPFGVGYSVCVFTPGDKNPERNFYDKYIDLKNQQIKSLREGEDDFVKLARRSLEHYINNNKELEFPDGLPAELVKTQAGVFVTIKKDGQLRGCIGTISPTKDCIAREIIENAISSGTRDPRFDRVEREELHQLVYSVDVLGSPEPVSDISELDPKEYGVIVSAGSRRGLLLPNLEGIDSVHEQISIALRKGGIMETEKYNIERFKVVRHK